MHSRHSFIFLIYFLLAAPHLSLGSEVFSLHDFRLDRNHIGVTITQQILVWANDSRPVIYPSHGIDPNFKSLLNIIVNVFDMFDTMYFDISPLFQSDISLVEFHYFVGVISRSFGYFNALLQRKNSARQLHVIVQCSMTPETCKFATRLANNANAFAAKTVSTIIVETLLPKYSTTYEASSSFDVNAVYTNGITTERKTNLLINKCETITSTELKMLNNFDEIALQLILDHDWATKIIREEKYAPVRQPVILFEAFTRNLRFCENILEWKKIQFIIYKIDYKMFRNEFKFSTWAYTWWLIEQYLRKHQVQAIIMNYDNNTIDQFVSMYIEKGWDSNDFVPYNLSYVYQQPPTISVVYQDAIIAIASAFTIVFTAIVPVFLAVYKCYIRPLQNQNYLTVTQIKDFFKGLPAQLSSESPEWMKKKYTKSLEIRKSEFVIDKTSKLGEGEFGIVYRGSLYYATHMCDVAFKTAKCSPKNIVGLEGLMSEIKILDYVGNHENIVRLLGAYTSKLRKGILYVAYELCTLGSLHKYLEQLDPNRRNRILDISSTPISTGYVIETGFSNDSLDTTELYEKLTKFSLQICTGMEYLAAKKIIHGDLATRNVLLTSTLQAKICDFGLSRRYYTYSEYVKKGEIPMAWRWMAPETLSKKGVLSSKTDVWSFGVTLWEIFSFGAIPFSGYDCDTAFVERLEYGRIRLPVPERCSQVYYEVMLSCWEINPSTRPNFARLLETLRFE